MPTKGSLADVRSEASLAGTLLSKLGVAEPPLQTLLTTNLMPFSAARLGTPEKGGVTPSLATRVQEVENLRNVEGKSKANQRKTCAHNFWVSLFWGSSFARSLCQMVVVSLPLAVVASYYWWRILGPIFGQRGPEERSA